MRIIVVVLVLSLFLMYFYLSQNSNLNLSINYKPPIENLKKLKSDIVDIPVYVLNLKKDYNRRKHMSELLSKLGFNKVEFVEPINKNLAMQHFNKINVNIKPSTASRTLSTFMIFDKVKTDKFIIAEDDINIFDDIYSIDDVYESSKNYNPDLLFFEMCWMNCQMCKQVDKCLYKLYDPKCNGFVLHNTNSNETIKKYYFGSEDSECLDVHLGEMSKNNLLKVYGYPIFRQNPNFGSNIETSPRWTDKSIKFDKICYI
jgi:hypothetical protein